MYSGLYVRGLRRGAGRRTSGCRQEQQRQQHGPFFSSGEVSSVFFWVLRLKFLRSPSTSRVSLSILRSSSCWATSQSAFSRRRGDVLLQYVVVLFAQQVDRALHVGQHVVAALAAADQPGDGSGQKAARQGIGQQVGDKCRVHFGSSCRRRLENAGFPKPCLHVERWAGFGCQFVMPYDGCAGKSGDEIPDVVFEGALFAAECGYRRGSCRRRRLLRRMRCGGWWRCSRRRRW